MKKKHFGVLGIENFIFLPHYSILVFHFLIQTFLKMQKSLSLFAAFCAVVMLFSACAKSDQITELAKADEITQDVKARITAMGFHAEEAIRTEGGYVVEGDIFLSDDDLYNPLVQIKALIVANTEQYRTNALVGNLPRLIKVRVSTTGMTTAQANAVIAATDAAVARYNAEGLSLTFQRVTTTSGVNITIKKAPNNAGYLASAGFPSNGNPYNTILYNVNYTNWNSSTMASIVAHEIGHCIGFRHTDYMDRSYSCGGAYYNEGTGGSIGAVHIPGTPTGPDANSWMLACIGNGINRPFNANDKTALNYLY
jgi:Dual-action HEIGH metallo-peptidase